MIKKLRNQPYAAKWEQEEEEEEKLVLQATQYPVPASRYSISYRRLELMPVNIRHPFKYAFAV
jgi:hypothetical protein